jgi:hypothetical protein
MPSSQRTPSTIPMQRDDELAFWDFDTNDSLFLNEERRACTLETQNVLGLLRQNAVLREHNKQLYNDNQICKTDLLWERAEIVDLKKENKILKEIKEASSNLIGKQEERIQDLAKTLADLRQKQDSHEEGRYLEVEEQILLQDACDRLTICCVGMCVVILCVEGMRRWGL